MGMLLVIQGDAELVGQGNSQAFIDPALAFVAHHFDGADFGGVGHVSAAIGLQVKTRYIDGPNLLDGRGQ